MGLTLEQAVLLDRWTRFHALRGRVTTLGVQHLNFSRREFEIAVGRGPRPASAGPSMNSDATMSAGELFAACGFTGTRAVDSSGHEGADILFDLNSTKLPIQLDSSTELLVNGGTLEHVFHVPNALSNMTRMLTMGGCVLHVMPCHNCVDHGFYQFGPTLVFDYYAAARFEILESAAIATSLEECGRRTSRVFPVAEGGFGTGLIGALNSEPLLYVALVRKMPSSIEAPVPTQRLYAKPSSRAMAPPRWFAPFSLAPGERPLVSDVREFRLGPFDHVDGFGWTCALPDLADEGDSLEYPIRSSLAVFEEDRALGPPHTTQADIVAHGGGAFSHWRDTLMISTSDGSDPNFNGRRYTARLPVVPRSPSAVWQATA